MEFVTTIILIYLLYQSIEAFENLKEFNEELKVEGLRARVTANARHIWNHIRMCSRCSAFWLGLLLSQSFIIAGAASLFFYYLSLKKLY